MSHVYLEEASAMHVIERRRDGYRPTVKQIAAVLKEARKLGFRTNWVYCGVLDDGSLSFGNPDEVNLVAFKRHGEPWQFMTEREYLALPAAPPREGEGA